MQIDHPQGTCAHAACNCPTESSKRYCSEFCRSAEEFSEKIPTGETPFPTKGCGCGHAECQAD